MKIIAILLAVIWGKLDQSTHEVEYYEGEPRAAAEMRADGWKEVVETREAKPAGLPDNYEIIRQATEWSETETVVSRVWQVVTNVNEEAEGHDDDERSSMRRTILASADSVDKAIQEAEQANIKRFGEIAAKVDVISSSIGGEDVKVVVTNNNSSTEDPALSIEFNRATSSTGSNWAVVWSEMTRWNKFLPLYIGFTNAINLAIGDLQSEKADRAFGYYDSHTGKISPDGYFSISAGNIIIAKDMAYQRTVTTEGAAWVLQSTYPMQITGIESNGFFRIIDGDGNSLFEIVKGDKREVPATYGGVTTTYTMGITHLHINFNVVSDIHPRIEICSDLKDMDWTREDDAGCPANISWSGSSGAWIAEVWGKTSMPNMFIKGFFEVGGETYVKNNVPVGLSQVMIGGINYNVTVETVSGKKLMVLTEAR